jgi:hypothetical protein
MLRNMDVWQWVLLAVAAFVAVTSLVRLMRARSDTVAREFRQQAAAERAKKAQEESEKKRRGAA